MSQLEKAKARLKSLPKDYTWDEADSLLRKLGFKKVQGDGSRVKFNHPGCDITISLHRPHPNPVLKEYAVKLLCDRLESAGIL